MRPLVAVLLFLSMLLGMSFAALALPAGDVPEPPPELVAAREQVQRSWDALEGAISAATEQATDHATASFAGDAGRIACDEPATPREARLAAKPLAGRGASGAARCGDA